MKSIIFLIFKLLMLGLFLGPFFTRAHALDELFNLYDSPQGLAMGNAFTADATGYAANYYNPAGLAKGTKSRWEVTAIAAEGLLSLAGIGTFVSAQSFATHRIHNQLAARGGGYYYQRANLLTSVQNRGFGFALLGSSELAGLSDGSQLDVRFTQDLVPTFGAAVNLAGNLVKIGIVGKAIARRQVKGVYSHAELATTEAINGQFKEGLAVGADVGLHVTLPNKYLPSIAFVYKDVLGTHFIGTSYLFEKNANGLPDSIPQSFNAAFSLRPHLSANVHAMLAIEFKHIELMDLSWQKRVHLGAQLEFNRSFFLWAGMNQMLPTGGMGLRVKGGNLEIGFYTVDVGVKADQRMFTRYTIGF